MIEQIVWTAGASEDFLQTKEVDSGNETFASALDSALELLRSFPHHGAKVGDSSLIRRILVGKRRDYGLYYGVAGRRLVVAALVNLRQDPTRIAAILRSRGILA